jgi:hypothetical protein
LTTKANLLRRGVLQEAVCVLCNQEIESTRHVLWDCPAAQDVWCACDRIFQKSSFEGSGFREIWEALIMRCNQEELAFSAILARNIWFRRNSFVHKGVFSHPNELVRDAEVSFQEFSHVKSMATGQNCGITNNMSVLWQPPPAGIFKVNWDVGFNPKLRRMGVGIIVRDDCGRIHVAQSKTLNSYQEPVVGEALVALQAVEFSRDLGLQDVLFEGDSLQVVNMMLEPGESWCHYGQIGADIKLLMGSFRSCEIKHVRQNQNRAAHGLAKEAVREVIDRVWME